jgi:hypothetical protein
MFEHIINGFVSAGMKSLIRGNPRATAAKGFERLDLNLDKFNKNALIIRSFFKYISDF